MGKWFRLRNWLHLLRRVWKLLRSPQVPLKDKLWFAVPVLLYWVLPDAIPFFPLDDVAVTMLLAGWFAGRMEKKHLS